MEGEEANPAVPACAEEIARPVGASVHAAAPVREREGHGVVPPTLESSPTPPRVRGRQGKGKGKGKGEGTRSGTPTRGAPPALPTSSVRTTAPCRRLLPPSCPGVHAVTS